MKKYLVLLIVVVAIIFSTVAYAETVGEILAVVEVRTDLNSEEKALVRDLLNAVIPAERADVPAALVGALISEALVKGELELVALESSLTGMLLTLDKGLVLSSINPEHFPKLAKLYIKEASQEVIEKELKSLKFSEKYLAKDAKKASHEEKKDAKDESREGSKAKVANGRKGD